jgi:hypothetical protein
MCINQLDIKEKTVQLGQMVNIYRRADNVCIWLGESDSDGRSDEAMDFISAIMDFAVLDRHARDKKQAKKWYGLAELMRDRWFSRRWVVQEISLAREATVHCGSKMVQWPDFADAVSLLVSNQETIKDLFDYSSWRDGPRTLGDVQSFGAHILLEATSKLFLRTAQGEITRPVKTVESLVTSLKTFDASDQRDLIYSLVSIASDTPQGANIYPGKRTGNQIAQLDVDYAKSPFEVYKDFTRFCIISSESLDVICRPWAMPVKQNAQKTTDKPVLVQLPSWIPLLSHSEFGEPEDVYSGRKNGENLVGPVGRPRYKASGDVQYDVGLATERSSGLQTQGSFPENDEQDITTHGYQAINNPVLGASLLVKGFKLAKIEKVSARNTGGVILRESLKMGGWTGIKENAASVPDRIWRTLVADRDPDGQIPPTWYQRACLRCLEIADTFNNGDLNVGELLQGHSEMLRKYLTRVRNVTWNRRFFRACMNETGSKKPEGTPGRSGSDGAEAGEEELPLFGVGPPGMKENDFVCILLGCSVPVVLREIGGGGGLALIGEAYVHGKMEGEAMEDLEKNDTLGQKVEFELK